MATLITRPDNITTAWLSAILTQHDRLSKSEVSAIEKTVSYPHGDRTNGTVIVQMRVTYSPEASSLLPTRLLLKLAAPNLQIGIAGLGQHEVNFYNAVSQNMGDLPVVRCYDAVYSREEGRYHLLLDDLSDTHLALPPSQLPPRDEMCELIIEALAKLHAHWWDHAKLGSEIGTPPQAEQIRQMMQDAGIAYRAFKEFLGSRLSAGRQRLYETALAGLGERLVARLCSGENLTITFEDVHAGNFLYPHDPARHRLYFIDWQQWGINIGPYDLAYMMGVFWSSERRGRLEMPYLQQYHAQLIANGVKGYSWESCWHDYRLALLKHLFTPVWQWQHGTPPDIWWNHFERITAACIELNCAELL